MGVPLVIIHFGRFSLINHPASGVPPLMETSISSFSRDDFHDYNSDPQTSPLNPLGFEDLLDDDELFLESDEDMFLEAETVSQNMRAD